MNISQVVDGMGNRVVKKDERSDQISFKLAAEDKLAFDVSVRQTGEDLTSVLRQMVKEYVAQTQPQKEQSAAARKRADLHASIIRGMRDYALRNKERPSMLRGIEDLLELRKGALSELANTE